MAYKNYNVGHNQDGDILSVPYGPNPVVQGLSESWLIAPAARRPIGGACSTWLKRERPYAGWAIWYDDHEKRKLFVFDSETRSILNSEGIDLPLNSLGDPLVYQPYGPDREGFFNLVVASDLQSASTSSQVSKDILVIDIDTAKVVDNFKVDGFGDHLLSPFPAMPPSLTSWQQKIFESLRRESIQAFKRKVTELVEFSRLEEADSQVLFAIEHFGSIDLKHSSTIEDIMLRIVGWDEICADLVAANDKLAKEKNKQCKLMSIGIFDRTGGGIDERLTIGRTFYAGARTDIFGKVSADWQGDRIDRNSDYSKRPAWIEGLERLTEYDRQPPKQYPIPMEEREAIELNKLLCQLLLLVKKHKVVESYLERLGLPIAVEVEITGDQTTWPQESNIFVRGLDVRRTVDSEKIATKFSKITAEDILVARKSNQEWTDKQTLIEMLAQIRECYRILRLFPFYRFSQRRDLSRIVDFGLHTCCDAQSIPKKGVSCSMSKRKFEALLKKYVESRGEDPFEMLNPFHTDRFHQLWLSRMKETNFKYKERPGMSLYEIALNHAVVIGGPIVQYRWEYLGRYVE
jgi:hypothetical protein